MEVPTSSTRFSLVVCMIWNYRSTVNAAIFFTVRLRSLLVYVKRAVEFDPVEIVNYSIEEEGRTMTFLTSLILKPFQAVQQMTVREPHV